MCWRCLVQRLPKCGTCAFSAICCFAGGYTIHYNNSVMVCDHFAENDCLRNTRAEICVNDVLSQYRSEYDAAPNSGDSNTVPLAVGLAVGLGGERVVG